MDYICSGKKHKGYIKRGQKGPLVVFGHWRSAEEIQKLKAEGKAEQVFLKNDSTAFIRACSEAQKAADYILGVSFKEEQEAA